MLWSLCKLLVATMNPVLLCGDRWVQDQALREAVAAQDRALVLFLVLTQRPREPTYSSMSQTGSGNIRLQCQQNILFWVQEKHMLCQNVPQTQFVCVHCKQSHFMA